MKAGFSECMTDKVFKSEIVDCQEWDKSQTGQISLESMTEIYRIYKVFIHIYIQCWNMFYICGGWPESWWC